MPYELVVTIPELDPLQFPLPDGRFRLGSSADCEICVDFEEVGRVAAQIEVRGGAVFLRNMNPFPIYVGQRVLNSSEQSEWPVGQTVLLTENVSLIIHDEEKKDAATEAEEAAKRTRSTIQMAVVCLCLGLGYFLLSGEDGPSQQSTEALCYGFTELVQQFELSGRSITNEDEKRHHRILLNHFIDARVADVRWGDKNPSRAISEYELVLDSLTIREADRDSDSPEDRVRKYALARVSDLSANLSVED